MKRAAWTLRCLRSGIHPMLALLAVSISLLACDRPADSETAVLVPGNAFPEHVLDFISASNDVAGTLQGRMLVLNVWATWCPPCRSEMPGLERLSRALDPKRFVVIGLSVDSDTLLASEFLLQHGITFANFFDKDGQMMRPLGLKVYPETFVIGPDRKLVRRVTGMQEWDRPKMIGALEELYQAQQRATSLAQPAR